MDEPVTPVTTPVAVAVDGHHGDPQSRIRLAPSSVLMMPKESSPGKSGTTESAADRRRNRGRLSASRLSDAGQPLNSTITMPAQERRRGINLW
jgi:hypothetical protein